MKCFLKVCLAVVVLLPMEVLAEVSLRLGDGVRIVAVNADMATKRSEADVGAELKVDDGKTQLVVEYSAEVRGSAGGEFLETSDAHVLLFEAHETSLALTAPEINSQYEMDAFNRSLQWRLVDHRGREIDYAVDVLEKKGFQLGRNYGQELAAFNQTSSPAAYSMSSGVISDVDAFESVGSTNRAAVDIENSRSLSDQVMVERMLKYWYRQAGQVARNNFKSWIEISR